MNHKQVKLTCNCGTTVGFSKIQYDDFDCGMMGFLYCPTCKGIMMPSGHRNIDLQEEEFEVEGQDMGWDCRF